MRMHVLVGVVLSLILVIGCSRSENEVKEEVAAPEMKAGIETSQDDTVPFSALTEKPVLQKRVEPEYPEQARKAGLEGRVVLRGTVYKDGKVGDVEILKSSGYPELDQKAVEAFRQFEFTPGKINGEPVNVRIVVPFQFRVKMESD
ncbi:MAG: energy transducer TonB [Calditrichaeota bacterium]|nr:energy transducer TonB [Calditrichota bacterium]